MALQSEDPPLGLLLEVPLHVELPVKLLHNLAVVVFYLTQMLIELALALLKLLSQTLLSL